MTPRALAPFLAFPPALRAAGFAAAPEQLTTFLQAVSLLGPTGLPDIRRAAHAVFGPAPERKPDFDAVFDTVFLGRAFAAPATGAPEDMPQSWDAGDFDLIPEPDEQDPSGAQATIRERLFTRDLAASPDADGGECNHRNDNDKILNDQKAEGDLAVQRVDFALVRQEFDDDDRRGCRPVRTGAVASAAGQGRPRQ